MILDMYFRPLDGPVPRVLWHDMISVGRSNQRLAKSIQLLNRMVTGRQLNPPVRSRSIEVEGRPFVEHSKVPRPELAPFGNQTAAGQQYVKQKVGDWDWIFDGFIGQAKRINIRMTWQADNDLELDRLVTWYENRSAVERAFWDRTFRPAWVSPSDWGKAATNNRPLPFTTTVDWLAPIMNEEQ